jgi:hypothetical protein
MVAKNQHDRGVRVHFDDLNLFALSMYICMFCCFDEFTYFCLCCQVNVQINTVMRT